MQIAEKNSNFLKKRKDFKSILAGMNPLTASAPSKIFSKSLKTPTTAFWTFTRRVKCQ